jgi:hypothetical protein
LSLHVVKWSGSGHLLDTVAQGVAQATAELAGHHAEASSEEGHADHAPEQSTAHHVDKRIAQDVACGVQHAARYVANTVHDAAYDVT